MFRGIALILAWSVPTSREEFEELVLEVVGEWIVGGFLTIGEEIVAAVLAVYDSLESVGGSLASPLTTLGGLIGEIPYLLLTPVDTLLTTVAASTGPFAPIAVVAIWSVTVVVLVTILYLILSVIIRVIPFL